MTEAIVFAALTRYRNSMKELLEKQQVGIYLASVVLAMLTASLLPGTTVFENAINPALAVMLFVTFLQVPLADLGRAFAHARFLAALLTTNFLAIPFLVVTMMQFLPSEPLVRLGVLLVLLTPCIDYVVTFSQLGRADARLLLAATPALLVMQMALLPIYLGLFLGAEAAALVQPGPFVHAFIWLIAVPLVLAGVMQIWATRHWTGQRVGMALSFLPVPATALVLFIVVASVLPQLGSATEVALIVMPFYIVFAVLAPLIGWGIAWLFRLDSITGRAVSFSAGTRNSLVVLPLALAVPGAIPVLPAIVVTQTLVELMSELIYVRLIARLGRIDHAETRPAP
ncbi:arsenic resistance protein [Noviherbaspirillum sp. CPCC 100848]|uniref:Arsenic resistance protein n=1 Tax=Noviherbaspirillum album TaxID=3080276 RepID=A0ABU6JGI7_9BURK|nr:arsenic resistance protein [Noviherbaspirillum sp. CPCC 100848]MEC4722219.1 arsenic resistance protein [Noviherbaspirillum sp. CPCC 100848]